MKKKFLIVFLILAVFLTTGSKCSITGTNPKNLEEPITINYWRVFDGQDVFDEIIKEYNQMSPNVTINYRKINYEDYERELLNALAEDRGPDIFSISNSWINEYQSKIHPMPETVTISRFVEQGTVKKEIGYKQETKKTISLTQLQNTFVGVVYDDVVMLEKETGKEKIHGLPLSVDTLAMYYNRDLFNNSGITEPPQHWDREFQNTIKNLTKQNTRGEIIQPGIAMGGSDNIERSVDILSLLMMQNGTTMMTDNGNVLFHATPTATRGYNPGLEALRFYTDFSNPAKEVYCWNDNMDDSLKLFTEGRLAIMFGYSYHLPTIRAWAPKLNFGIAKMPQINSSSGHINHANYWVETVSKKSQNKDVAWDFLIFLTQKEQAEKYLEKTKKPTALRSLIREQKEDRDLEVFADQLLTAQSWYKGHDAITMEKIIKEMIDDANYNPLELDTAINRAATRVQQTINK